MGEESEKRFNSIMDKLFHFPKPKPSSSSPNGAQLSRGQKRLNPESALSIVGVKSRGYGVHGSEKALVVDKSLQQVPICRPWDREDLTRRLATFKSMTWFGKPKVVGALNCARRGWVNVDTDIIECEACRARLLFSTPSSWNQHQVDNAALVFSLKLDTGHKTLCPWIDNACDEKLSQFPPMSVQDLVESYRERFYGLLQLSALPLVSTSFIEHMKNPQLERFLRNFSTPKCINGSIGTALTEYLASKQLPDSVNLYYQAQKLISLCGWQLHSLPYVVDSKNKSKQSAKASNHSGVPDLVLEGDSREVSVYHGVANETMEGTSGELQLDPNSVVLECKQCGATVGLWAFSKVARPIELFRLVGYSQVNGENDAGPSGASSAENGSTNMNLTIAGGPPPGKQNFRATISLPVIGQNLRARISSDRDIGDFINQENSSWNKISLQEGIDQTGNSLNEQVQPEEKDQPQKSNEDGHVPTTMGTSVKSTQYTAAQSSLNDNLSETEDNVGIITSTSASGNSIESHVRDHSANLRREISPHVQKTTETECSRQEGDGEKESQTSVCNGEGFSIATDLKQLRSHDAKKFDPFRQHRAFCPWITSTGSVAQGWQKTVSSLLRQEGSSHPSPTKSPSCSIIEVDDPIASVRRLFSSPSPKRTKYAQESSKD